MKRFEITYIDKACGNVYPMVTVVYASCSQKAVRVLSDDAGEIILLDVKEVKEPEVHNVA